MKDAFLAIGFVLAMFGFLPAVIIIMAWHGGHVSSDVAFGHWYWSAAKSLLSGGVMFILLGVLIGDRK